MSLIKNFITYLRLTFKEGYGFLCFKMLNLERFIFDNESSIGEWRASMGKKDDAKSVSEKARSYFEQGFN
jgi:hypothetical protein